MMSWMPLAAVLLAVCPAGRAAPSDPGAKAQPVDGKLLLQTQEECRQGTADYFRYLAKMMPQPKDYTLQLLVPKNEEDSLWRMTGEEAAACLDSAGDPKAPCDPLGLVDSESVGNCRAMGSFASFAAALYGQGDPRPAFSRYLRWDLGDVKFTEPEKEVFFKLFSQAYRTGNAVPLVAEMAKTKGVPAKEAAEGTAHMANDPGRCKALQNEYERALCVHRSQFLQALRSPDPKACAASPWCDAAKRRDPKACAPLLKKATNGFCVHLSSVAAFFVKQEEAKKAEESKNRAKGEEKRRKEAADLALLEKKRKEEEKLLKEKVKAEDYKLWQEVAARKRAQDDLVLKAMQEKKRKKQFKEGQRMETTPLDALKAIDEVNRGKAGPQAQPLEGQ